VVTTIKRLQEHGWNGRATPDFRWAAAWGKIEPAVKAQPLASYFVLDHDRSGPFTPRLAVNQKPFRFGTPRLVGRELPQNHSY